DKPLTPERLWGWQAALFPSGYSGMHKIRVGGWREGEEPMRVVFGPVGREMGRFLPWVDDSKGKVEGIIRAAVAHFWFVTIHPFEDGNGRIARALTDLALAQDDMHRVRYYSLSTQIMAERDAYYDILERSQQGTCDITQWLVWFLGSFARAIERSEEILDGVFSKSEFW